MFPAYAPQSISRSDLVLLLSKFQDEFEEAFGNRLSRVKVSEVELMNDLCDLLRLPPDECKLIMGENCQ